ncbi:uncharacterized protein LOC144351786 [Saccoglossus kowalevskii]
MKSHRRPNWLSRRVMPRTRSVVNLPRFSQLKKNRFLTMFVVIIFWTFFTYIMLSKVLPAVPGMLSEDGEVHLHGRSPMHASHDIDLDKEIPIGMFAPLNMEKREPSSGQKASDKYLLPILLGNQGLNNQLIGFKMSMAVSMYTNRTLVLAPFFDERKNTVRMRKLQDVIDVTQFRELLPTVSMEHYNKVCNGRVEALFSGINMSNHLTQEQYNGYLKSINSKVRVFKNLTGAMIPDFEKDRKVLIELPPDLKSGHLSLKTSKFKNLFESDSKCVGIAYPYGLMVRFYYYDYVPVFAQYLRRPNEIRQMADSFIWEVINSRNFLGIHWRFDDEWKRTWCNSGVHDENVRQNCNSLMMSSEKAMVAKIMKIMRNQSISSAYLATPPTTQDRFVIELKQEVPNVYSRDDLLGISILGLDFDLDDNFKLSLLEQEICAKSAVFIGSRMSAWSDIVAEDRNYKNRLYMPDIFKD